MYLYLAGIFSTIFAVSCVVLSTMCASSITTLHHSNAGKGDGITRYLTRKHRHRKKRKAVQKKAMLTSVRRSRKDHQRTNLVRKTRRGSVGREPLPQEKVRSCIVTVPSLTASKSVKHYLVLYDFLPPDVGRNKRVPHTILSRAGHRERYHRR